METKQLALFGDDEIVGTGKPGPWPAAADGDTREAHPGEDPNQLAFDDAGDAA
ncbi:hypothetical protein [Streptomyces chartreusis]|uniref:hypothetical protein n=1 Tax=Streptomyces chartreusis TaxID=1969 RepID=UPI00142E965A|nr:hypothetical protein [Streptomyces chartreusis]GGW99160.1 hypothetical protein GCM10010321_12050 [Streptomyces chartreusis]